MPDEPLSRSFCLDLNVSKSYIGDNMLSDYGFVIKVALMQFEFATLNS